MHSYSINSQKRENVTQSVAIISFILGIMIVILDIGGVLAEVIGIKSDDLVWIVLCEAFNALMPITVFQVIMYLYRHFLWKCFPFNRFHDIPDLNGTWEGELQSALKDKPRSIVVKIRQNWDNILINTETDSGAHAASFVASISTHEGRTILSYAFENIRQKGSYIGFNYLRLQDMELMGEYFTNKNISATGIDSGELNEKMRTLIADGMGSKGSVKIKRKT